MRLLLSLCCIVIILHCSYAPPVSPEKEKDSEVKDDLDQYMEYHRYLQEVVQALESDPDFRERIEKADEDDVRSGRIAEVLDFVNHNVRTKLDEIKRRELERLRHLATKQFELTNELNHSGKVPTNEHLDHTNPHTFEIEDLKKLIKKTTADLEAADKERREQFKEYEMQKEFEKHQKLETLDETQKKEYMENLKKEEEAKKHHKPLHHPGSKPQLEEVWEKQDNMDQQFDPKAFFMMHDVDGNGVWDADEVKALFIKELDKLYGPGGPNKDLHERAEEMERMREHVFRENDKNRDGLIDFHEFMTETQSADFNKDEGWKPIDENEVYSQQEYQEFEKKRIMELKYLQDLGLVDAHGRALPGAHNRIGQARHAFETYYHTYKTAPPPGSMYYHGQAGVPQYQSGQPHQGQFQPQGQFQQPQGQFQPPQGQFQQPQGQFQQPQGQFQQPQGQFQPPQGQFQPPQGQFQQPQGQFQQGQPQAQFQQAPGQFQQPQGQFKQPQGQFQQPPQGLNPQAAQGQFQQPQGQHQQFQQNGPGQYQQQGQFQGQAQGQVPQGQVPQGQVPQGQVPQGQVPQAQQPQTGQQQAQSANVNQPSDPATLSQGPPQGLAQPSQGQAQAQTQASQGQAPPAQPQAAAQH